MKSCFIWSNDKPDCVEDVNNYKYTDLGIHLYTTEM